MVEEFEEIEVEYACLEEGEIDFDYEFDAPQFCDFTLPETFLNDSEAEQWFEFAESYPPSPFLMKLRWGNSCEMEGEENEISATEEYKESGVEPNGETKRLNKSISGLSSKCKNSSFMQPTASNLAKHKNPTEVPTPRRFKTQTSSPSIDSQLTKRQKLEASYLRKVSRLKHQALFTHKKSNEADPTGVNVTSRPKATVPKEPNLVTALRAQRPSRSKIDAESGGNTKPSSQMFKARPLNKKILEAPTQSLHKKKTSQVTEFNVFHLNTSKRAMQNTSSNGGGNLNSNSISSRGTREPKRTNSSDGLRQDKSRMVNKLRGIHDDKKLSGKGERGVFQSIKVFPLDPNYRSSTNEPPTDSFSKLSLVDSEVKQATNPSSKEQRPNSKGLKENRPESMHQELEMNLAKEEIKRLCLKQYQFVKEMESLISKHTCMLASRKNQFKATISIS